MTRYLVYRDGTKPMLERIKSAVAHYYQQNRKLPVRILVHQSVHASEIEDAQAAVKTLELNLPVRGNGGPLKGEVWLQVTNSEKKPALEQKRFELE